MKTLYLYNAIQRVIKTLCMVLITAGIVSAQISHSVNFKQSAFSHSTEKARDDINYTKISMEGLYRTSEIGNPELPVKRINLLIPSNQDVFSVIVMQKQTENISGNYTIIPVQHPVPTNGGELPPFVKPNPTIYESDELYPAEIVRVVNDGYFDGSNHIVTLEIFPIQYKPKSGKLIFHSHIDFKLEFGLSSKKTLQVHQRSEKAQEIYNSILKNIVENPLDVNSYQIVPVKKIQINKLFKGTTSQKTSTVPFYEYVLITSNTLKPYFSNFISWKKRKGWDIGIVTTEEIFSQYSGDYISGIYDDAGKIRQYLSDAYQDGTIWALLGGDYTVVPIRYGCGSNNFWTSPDYDFPDDYKIPTDLYFSDFNGDWDVDGSDPDGQVRYGEITNDDPDYNPEIFVGRLLCSNATAAQDISNWTEKLIKYEQNPGNGDLAYLTKSFMVEADELADQNQAEAVKTHYPSVFQSNTTIYKELPAGYSAYPTFPTGAQVIEEMNNRYGIISWFCHGNPEGISVKAAYYGDRPRNCVTTLDSYFDETPETGNGLDNLTNDNYPSVLYSIGCDNATLDHYDPKGWWPGRNTAQGFTVITNNGGPAYLGNSRYGWLNTSYLLYNKFADLITAGNTKLGVAELISKSAYNGGTKHYLNYSHNLLGCPETDMWTATPSTLANVTITDNGSSITVSAGISGCNITACSGNNGAQYYLATNNVSSYTFSTSVRPLYITVIKQNYIPYIGVTGGTFSTNENWFGNMKVLGNVIVSSGNTLTIAPSTTLKFSPGTSLTINGILVANATVSQPITFTAASGTTPGSWGSIVLNGSGANNSSITYANIQYGTQIDITNVSNVTIQNCSITNFSGHGINLYYSSGNISYNTISSSNINHGIIIAGGSVNCTENVVKKNDPNRRRGVGIYYGGASGYVRRNDVRGWDWGICAIWGASPYSLSSYNKKNNRITDCNYGLMVYRLSYAVFGSPPPSDDMNNSIDNMYNASVGIYYSDFSSGLYAFGNWWGYSPPVPSKFQVGPNAYFYYTPYLSKNPWDGYPLPSVIANDGSGIKSPEISASIKSQGDAAKSVVLTSDVTTILNESDPKDDLLIGVEMIAQNKHREAKDFFISYLKKNPNDQAGYVWLYNCYNDETTDEIVKYFENLPKSVSKDFKLLLSHLYLRQGKIEQAKATNNLIINENKNTDIAVKAKLDNFYIALYNENDPKYASRLLSEAYSSSKLSTSVEIELAQSLFKTYVDPKAGNMPFFDKEHKEYEVVSDVIETSTFLENYPNPFNPTTTINYQIGVSSKVSIKIYDILGREVSVLVDGVKESGYYKATFDASNLASGIYFAKLTAVPQDGSERIIQVKKMLLIK